MNLHYGEKYNDMEYNQILVKACSENGIAAFTGDGTNPAVMEAASKAIAAEHGNGIPTIKLLAFSAGSTRRWGGDATANVCFTYRKEQAWNIRKTERGRGCPF